MTQKETGTAFPPMALLAGVPDGLPAQSSNPFGLPLDSLKWHNHGHDSPFIRALLGRPAD
jgi:hypothetical protein